jgi:hypothetical protein
MSKADEMYASAKAKQEARAREVGAQQYTSGLGDLNSSGLRLSLDERDRMIYEQRKAQQRKDQQRGEPQEEPPRAKETIDFSKPDDAETPDPSIVFEEAQINMQKARSVGVNTEMRTDVSPGGNGMYSSPERNGWSAKYREYSPSSKLDPASLYKVATSVLKGTGYAAVSDGKGNTSKMVIFSEGKELDVKDIEAGILEYGDMLRATVGEKDGQLAINGLVGSIFPNEISEMINNPEKVADSFLMSLAGAGLYDKEKADAAKTGEDVEISKGDEIDMAKYSKLVTATAYMYANGASKRDSTVSGLSQLATDPAFERASNTEKKAIVNSVKNAMTGAFKMQEAQSTQKGLMAIHQAHSDALDTFSRKIADIDATTFVAENDDESLKTARNKAASLEAVRQQKQADQAGEYRNMMTLAMRMRAGGIDVKLPPIGAKVNVASAGVPRTPEAAALIASAHKYNAALDEENSVISEIREQIKLGTKGLTLSRPVYDKQFTSTSAVSGDEMLTSSSYLDAAEAARISPETGDKFMLTKFLDTVSASMKAANKDKAPVYDSAYRIMADTIAEDDTLSSFAQRFPVQYEQFKQKKNEYLQFKEAERQVKIKKYNEGAEMMTANLSASIPSIKVSSGKAQPLMSEYDWDDARLDVSGKYTDPDENRIMLESFDKAHEKWAREKAKSIGMSYELFSSLGGDVGEIEGLVGSATDVRMALYNTATAPVRPGTRERLSRPLAAESEISPERRAELIQEWREQKAKSGKKTSGVTRR